MPRAIGFLARAVRFRTQHFRGETREKIQHQIILTSHGVVCPRYHIHSVARIRRGESRTENHSGHHPSLGLLRSCQFQPALGSGTCNRDTSTGAITVTGFLGEVTSDKSAGAWRFSPDEIKSKHGKVALALQNVGGETHTFTKVKKFGGGFVDALNQASGNPVPAPECAQMVNGVLTPQAPGADNLFIPAGGTATASTPRREDATRYQCCIHPWMRLVVGEDHDNDNHGH